MDTEIRYVNHQRIPIRHVNHHRSCSPAQSLITSVCVKWRILHNFKVKPNYFVQETAQDGVIGLQSGNIIGEDPPRPNINHIHVGNITYLYDLEQTKWRLRSQVSHLSHVPVFNIFERIHQQSGEPYLMETQQERKLEICTVKRDPFTFIW